MSLRSPMLAICDLVAWRLDLFEAALHRALAAFADDPAAFELTVGYRLRDDLALIVLQHDHLSTDELESIVFAQRLIPGFRRLPMPGGVRTAHQAGEIGLRSCELVTQSKEPREIVRAIRHGIGLYQDQRAAYRLSVEVPLRIDTPGGWLSATTRDLSAGGVFIHTRQPLEIGETYPVVFFPDEKLIEAARGELTVVRADAEGFGARVRLTELGQAQIYRYLRAVRLPRAPDETTLPLVAPGTSPLRALRTQVASVQERLAESSAPRARVLLAVGHAPLRLQLVRTLGRLGFEVLSAASGAEALMMLVDELLALDVMLIDEQLGDVAGTELLTTIRRSGGETELPIIAMTSEDDGPSRTALLHAGASATLPVRGAESMTHATLLSLLPGRIKHVPVVAAAGQPPAVHPQMVPAPAVPAGTDREAS